MRALTHPRDPGWAATLAEVSFPEPVPEYDVVHDDLPGFAGWDLPGEPFGFLPGAAALADPLLDDGAPVAEPGTPGDEALSRAARVRRAGATAAVFTALAMAYKEVFEPEREQEVVVEVDAAEPNDLQPVTFIMVPGNPRASRVVIRRWLFP